VLTLAEDLYQLRPSGAVELRDNGVFRVIARDRDVHF
jgi:hypothetical protein